MKMKYNKMALRLIIGFVALLPAAGCAAGGPLGDERKWVPGMGDVPDRIGHAPGPADENRTFPNLWSHDDVPAKIGLTEPTGKWFFLNGEGKLGYGLTGGVRRPESEWKVTLFGHEEGGVPVNRDVRVRLVARSPDLAEKAVVSEEIVRVDAVTGEKQIASGRIPEGDNALYSLSAEILDAKGRAEDARVSLIYAPAPEINASLSTDRGVYGTSDRTAQLVLKNDGPTVLMLGLAYTVEKLVDDRWRVVPLDLAFPEIALYLMPGESHRQPFDLSGLTEGRYRIIKTVLAEGFEDLSAVLAAEFRVEHR